MPTTNISDPAQLLRRIPELESLSEDPKIRHAIESGDPFKVYRALVWVKWLRRLPHHSDTLKLLIRQRRLFAKPLKRAPSLGTVNSVGFGFVGAAERDTDGSHVALHALVILFAVPIVPLGSYLVMSTGVRKWRIFARVPMGLFAWLYSRGLALMLVLTVLGGAISSFHKSRYQDVTVLNGFELPVDVVLAGKKQVIPPRGRAVFNVAIGEVSGSAAVVKLGTIDSYQKTVSSHGGYTIWNIAGATPLTLEQVRYYKTPPSKPEDSLPSIYCGERYVDIYHVDFAFQDSPKTISMGKYESVVSRSHLDIARVDKRSGATLCVNYLYAKDKLAQASPLFEALAVLSGWDVDMARNAVGVARMVSAAESLRIARRAIAAKPDAVELQRSYQWAREELGQRDAVLQQYADRAEKQPDSAASQYLYAVLLKGSAGQEAIEHAATKFERDPNILGLLGRRRAAAGDYEGASQSYQRLRQVSPKTADESLDIEVQVLMALRRPRDALELISKSFSDMQSRQKERDAANYALVARLSGLDPMLLMNELSKAPGSENVVEAIRARVGLDPLQVPEKRSRLVNLELSLRNDPLLAMKFAASLGRGELNSLGAEQVALLYCEAARTGDKLLLDHLAQSLPLSRSDRESLEKYVRGETVSLAELSFDPQIQAAALFIRSRNGRMSPAEKTELRQQAERVDFLHTVISSALHQWPA